MRIHGTKEIPKPTKEQTIEATNQLKDYLKQLKDEINPSQIENGLIEEIKSISNLDLSPENLNRGTHLDTIGTTCKKIRCKITANVSISIEEEDKIHTLLAKIDECVSTLRFASRNTTRFFG